MNIKKRAFSAVTEATAEKLTLGLKAAAAAGFHAMLIQGAWKSRRLIIHKILVAPDITAALEKKSSNLETLTLLISTAITPTEFMRECRSFGARAEWFWRQATRDQFDFVVSFEDGARHFVHRYHHVALCKHNPSRWLLEHEIPTGFEVGSCAACKLVAANKPAHRVRWHPLAAEGQEALMGKQG
ncbi:hypothetical protein [Caldimonas tepidiphila]|uniref:hypothetical protein n=1 Tax=Caldimonas tepidiphila TaxID=2315841 RepID=UPI0013009403|nr:hypothetical protein [Caldimonas tepidiphila]